MPEVLEVGITGYVVADVVGAARAVERRVFTERFTAARMAGHYLAVYCALLCACGSLGPPGR